MRRLALLPSVLLVVTLAGVLLTFANARQNVRPTLAKVCRLICCRSFSIGSDRVMPVPRGRTEGSVSAWPIVKHIVDAHRGTIEARGDGENREAVFLVRLSMAEALDEHAVDPMSGETP